MTNKLEELKKKVKETQTTWNAASVIYINAYDALDIAIKAYETELNKQNDK